MGNLFSMKSVLNEANAGLSNECSVKEIQAELLAIYKDVFEACEKHNLQLFLQGGTLLGKKRHNGFIPWDDDMDLGLMRADYDKFSYVFDLELKEKYELRMPGYPGKVQTRFAKVYKRENSTESRNLSIDIFPIDYVPENGIVRLITGLKCNALIGISGSIEFISKCPKEQSKIIRKSVKGRLNYDIRWILNALFGKKSVEHWYLKLDNCVRNNAESQFCTSALGRWHYFGEMQPADVFIPLKKTEYCGCSAWSLNSDSRYLEHNYGRDYMEIPPEKKREVHI